MTRLISVVCVCIALLTHPAVHAELNEPDAIARGMAQPHVQALLNAQLEQAKGEQQAAGRWENPEVEYSQEAIDLLSGRSEETSWWLRQRLNITGSKGIERDAAAKAMQAAEARVLLQRRQWRTQMREQFYAALAAQTEAQVLGKHRRRLQRVATAIEQRVAQGDASRYDSLRINQELARAQSDYGHSQAELQAERQRLFSLVGGAPEALGGALLPPALTTGQQNLEQLLEQHPQLQILAAMEQSASLSAKAARRQTWPELSVGLGRKRLKEAGFSAEGNAVALSVEIPLFDRSQGDVQRTRALAREYVAEYSLMHNRLSAHWQALRISLAAQRESAQALRQAITKGTDSLSAIAEASYQAGELSVMELLDAYRTDLETWLQYVDNAHAARTTFIQLQQLEGQ